VPAPQSAAAASNSSGKDGDTDKNSAQATAGNTGDTKSTHAGASDATPQPVPPASPVHAATPANTAPQIAPFAVAGGANPPAGAGNLAPTASVHLANAGADPTPDTNALAVSVAARSLSGARQFDIRLDPAELGHVEVRLSIDASGKTQAHMTADQPQTLALLQKDAPNLTQALRDAGLNVSQGGLNFSLRGQDRQSGDRNSSAGQGRRTNLSATRAIGAVQGPMPVSFNGAAADARVDIHV
jgi:flagellar hook-length control protein FliK